MNIKVITTKTDIPENTISHPGFWLMDMGKDGKWLVDEDHPGYRGCLKKAIQVATAKGNQADINYLLSYPAGELYLGPVELPSVIKEREEERKKKLLDAKNSSAEKGK